MKPIIAVLALGIGLLCQPTAEGQILRRLFGGGVQSSCPNGNCPTTNTRQVTRQVTRTAGHWSYPGSISTHLQTSHGINTGGMTYSQMLNTHDAIHEGRYQTVMPSTPHETVIVQPPVIQYAPAPVQVAPVVVQPPVVIPKSKPVIVAPSETTFGLGSTASAPRHVLAQFGTEAAEDPEEVKESLFGLTIGNALGKSIPSHVLGQFQLEAEAGTFKSALLKGITSARKAGNITVFQALRLRIACMSPAFVERAEELAVVQIAFSGQESEQVPVNDDGSIDVAGINWEGLIKFMEAFIPLLLSLLQALGV